MNVFYVAWSKILLAWKGSKGSEHLIISVLKYKFEMIHPKYDLAKRPHIKWQILKANVNLGQFTNQTQLKKPIYMLHFVYESENIRHLDH